MKPVTKMIGVKESIAARKSGMVCGAEIFFSFANSQMLAAAITQDKQQPEYPKMSAARPELRIIAPEKRASGSGDKMKNVFFNVLERHLTVHRRRTISR